MGSILVLLCASALLFFSETAMQSALDAARIFVSGVMPALFPMMLLSRLLPPASSAAPLRLFVQTAAFSCLSGSPASAQRACSLPLPASLLEKLLCASGLMSPMFFTGTLARWCQSSALGWKMLAAHWLSAWLAAWLWPAASEAPQKSFPSCSRGRCSLPEAVGQSAQSLLGVCGAMMLFSILAGVCAHSLALILPRWTQAHAPLLAVLWALMEIGSGARAVIYAFPQPPCALLCALCSFGGLSLWLQNLLFAGEKIRPAKLLCMRVLHGALAYGVFSFLSFL